MTKRSWILLLTLAALWGASYLFIEVALKELSAWGIVFARTLLGAAVLLPLALRRGGFGSLRGMGLLVAGTALLQVAGPFVLIAAGQVYISSSLAGILVATAPIFTALLAFRYDRAGRARGLSMVGILLGIAGVALLFGVDLGGGGMALVGGLMVTLAGLGYALGAFIVKRRFAAVQPVSLAAATSIAAALLLAPAAALTAPSQLPATDTLLALLALGALGAGVGFAIFYTLISEIGPGRASLVAYIAPGFAVVYGVSLLGEQVTLATLAGLVLIVGGSWLAAGGRPADLMSRGRGRGRSTDVPAAAPPAARRRFAPHAPAAGQAQVHAAAPEPLSTSTSTRRTP